jgi:protease I
MRIACLLDRDFEDSEFKKPYDAFNQAGHEVTIVGHEAGKELKGKKGQETARSERAIDEIAPDEFDAMFIPGGQSPDHLRMNKKMCDFAAAMMDAGKPAFVICHGPQLLITAERYKGPKMTAWYTIQGDLQKMGANVVDQEVCVDGSLVTSRKPDDIPAFIRESLAMLQQRRRSAA